MKRMKKKLIVALSATALGMTAAAGLAKQGWADDSASQIPTTGEKLAGAPDTATLPWGTFTLNPRIAAKVKAHDPINYVFSYQASGIPLFSPQYKIGFERGCKMGNAIYPMVPGHEIVGTVTAVGVGVTDFVPGDRVGVPWLGHTCGHCRYCGTGRENLCDTPGFTGYTLDGGYAERVSADARYCLHLPPRYTDVEAAPLMCAGLIGYRTLAMAGDAQRIGIYGFGAAAHFMGEHDHVHVYEEDEGHAVVDAHGGTIRARPRSEGGLIVDIELPARP